ncbi:malonate decarboxylase holo-[acyl-carrier-protein] synthase [Herminiimonas sp. KBW02]|uniref:malonate decarboxylase holo-[acyl-carrier-protein] synthase n=1 Tax=Herminiimonas sp. KBW02 TaxID=2153363 RepID=UPI000FAC0EC0|nr:malonate decarboxylase holo-[acyl-carrier-protein] synthase [Herminiimonas sp. KBW02]RQO37323.1 malonate decarboxylase holo-[acyl-carrier-protein] synthase [Herminiimonas sp. KBW02]
MIAPQSSSFFYKRHARVWLNWPEAAECMHVQDGVQAAAIHQHAARGLPFVARSRQPGERPDMVQLGLRLPRTTDQRSLAFCVPASVVREASDALSLSEALLQQTPLPNGWYDTLMHLQTDALKLGLNLRIYGSLAWQCVTGTPYLADNSDVDLLLAPATLEQAHAGLRLLDAVEKEGRVRLDGEMIFPDGRAVAWKELLAHTRLVMVKSNEGVALATLESVWKQSAWH